MIGDKELGIDGVKLIESYQYNDSRGKFLKYLPNNYLTQKLDSVALSVNSNIGTIRGIHFQTYPFAEEKLISCIKGSTYEVIIDLRPNSQTLGKVVTFELSEGNARQVYLPQGIAHGYQTLEENTIVQYILTSEYSQIHSFSIDPIRNIEFNWPVNQYIISDKDANGLSISEACHLYRNSIEKSSSQ